MATVFRSVPSLLQALLAATEQEKAQRYEGSEVC